MALVCRYKLIAILCFLGLKHNGIITAYFERECRFIGQTWNL